MYTSDSQATGCALYEKFVWSTTAPERPAPIPASTTRGETARGGPDREGPSQQLKLFTSSN